jgi:hypothetical protein
MTTYTTTIPRRTTIKREHTLILLFMIKSTNKNNKVFMDAMD